MRRNTLSLPTLFGEHVTRSTAENVTIKTKLGTEQDQRLSRYLATWLPIKKQLKSLSPRSRLSIDVGSGRRAKSEVVFLIIHHVWEVLFSQKLILALENNS